MRELILNLEFGIQLEDCLMLRMHVLLPALLVLSNYETKATNKLDVIF